MRPQTVYFDGYSNFSLLGTRTKQSVGAAADDSTEYENGKVHSHDCNPGGNDGVVVGFLGSKQWIR